MRIAEEKQAIGLLPRRSDGKPGGIARKLSDSWEYAQQGERKETYTDKS